MINKIKENIVRNVQLYAVLGVLFLYFLILIRYSFYDVSIWWDQAVYIGMGKHIASGGSLGMWEMFRPPLFPLFYALLYILNIPLVLAGKTVVVLASVGSVWLSYLLGEKIKKGAGIFAGIFLMMTPVFLYFSKIATTDIISIFFVLLSVYFYSKKKYFLTGISVALVFLLRFPQGLILVSFGLAVLCDTYNRNFILWFKDAFNKILLIGLGFITFVVPYLLSNYLLYGDVFKPLIMASDIVTNGGSLYDFGTFYYAKEIFKMAPFLYLSLLTPFILFKKDYIGSIQKKNLRILIIAVTVFMAYFFWQVHKELRYSIAFIPYLAILSGVSMTYLLSLFKKAKIVLLALLFFCFLLLLPSADLYLNDGSKSEFVPLYNSLETLKGNYLSTTTIPVVFGQVKLLSIFESRSSFGDVFRGHKDTVDGVIFNSCDIFCKEGRGDQFCANDINLIDSEILSASYKKVYQVEINKCNFNIYKK